MHVSTLHRSILPIAGTLAGLFLCTSTARAEGLDSGDTAWMLTATALVLMMTLPGLALFYGGLVRTRNVLSLLMQCLAIAGLVTVIWVVYGFSLAFSNAGMEAGSLGLPAFVGGLDRMFLAGLTPDSLSGTIPEALFMTFQLTFAIITPALIVGAVAERMRFSALLIFITLWVTVVYFPIAHMVWAGDGALFWDMGVLDFAGGTVVHINAGVAGLVAAIVLGPRRGYPNTAMPPHNLTLTVIGAALLWVGWFGFNAGSAVAANGTAAMAMLVTQVATATAVLGWIGAEWIIHKKPSVLGAASGAIAGLVAVTPAAGTIGPGGALALGLIAGVACFFAATSLKRALKYDDSLDVFGVHGVGGLVGALLTGILTAEVLGGTGLAEGRTMLSQLGIQAVGAGLTIAYCAIATWVLLKLVDRIVPLRVDAEDETQGLDLALHDERGYNL